MATIRKRNGRFQAQVRVKGSDAVSRTFETKVEAQRWARSIEVAIDDGSRPKRTCQKQAVTFGEVLGRYQAEITPGKKWGGREVSIIKGIMTTSLWDTNIHNLTEEQAATYRNNRSKTVAPATVVRELALLAHSLEVARRDWGYDIKCNCFKLVKKPVVRNGRERRLTNADKQKIFGETHNEKMRFVVMCIEFSVETAVRKGEMLNITKKDINFDASTLIIPKTKNGHPRTIPLSPKAIKLLRQAIEHSSRDYVFDIKYWTLSQRWERLREMLKIRDLRWHDLRHEAISRLFEKGLSVPEVALISGHRDTKLLARYTHIRPESIAAKLALLSAQSE